MMSHDEQEIRQLVATWAQATQRGDTQTMLDLMADDVIFLAPSQPPMLGKAAFAAASNAAASAPSSQFEIDNAIQEITILGDWAYMWTRLNVVISPANGGHAITRAGHTLTILRKIAGKWVIARDANMLALLPN